MNINLRVSDFEKIANFCKLSGHTKKDVIVKAMQWQFDNFKTECLTYVPGTRRTATVILSPEETADLNSLAEYLQCTPAQAGLIAVRNFIAANEEGRDDYFASAELAEVPINFLITAPADVIEAVKATGKPITACIREAIHKCGNAKALPMLPKRGKGKRPVARAYLPQQEDRDAIVELMRKHGDSPTGVIARCLAATYLYNLEADNNPF